MHVQNISYWLHLYFFLSTTSSLGEPCGIIRDIAEMFNCEVISQAIKLILGIFFVWVTFIIFVINFGKVYDCFFRPGPLAVSSWAICHLKGWPASSGGPTTICAAWRFFFLQRFTNCNSVCSPMLRILSKVDRPRPLVYLQIFLERWERMIVYRSEHSDLIRYLVLRSRIVLPFV